jgi:D-alanyl-lipoteichoic acid acyltransferase DltB (MBOAT superfamily)
MPNTKENLRRTLHDAQKTYIELSGSCDIDDHIIFEPTSFRQKLRSVAQNMFEIEAIILIVFLGYQHISLMAMAFLMLSNILLVSATWKRDHRLKYGMLITFGLMATVVGIMVIKLFMSWTVKKLNVEDCKSVIEKENYYMAWGFPTKIFIDFKSTSGESMDDPCQGFAD